MAGKAATLPIDASPVTETVTLERQKPELPQPNGEGVLGMIERLADRVGVDVLERFIAMRDRERGQQAEAAFNAAFTAMQPEIPTIIERASTDKTTYAPLEDIIEVIRPIYSRFGFSLGFQTEWLNEGKTVKVIGILTHTDGHARRSEFMAAADTSGSKNAIQALASSVSYGKRYATKDLFCIVTRKEDDDGERAGKANQPDTPKGYDDFVTDMTACADEGMKALEEAWAKASGPFKAHTAKHNRRWWEAAKAKAKTQDASHGR